MRIFLIIFAGLFFSSMSFASTNELGDPNFKKLMGENHPTYIVTNSTGYLYSFDPIEGLNLRNSRILRMIHTRLIEPNDEGRYSSRVLKSFAYNSEYKTLVLDVGASSFNDGTPITIEDILMTIKRVAFLRPDYPVVSKIAGLKKWLQAKTPLASEPQGIFRDGNKIKIKFTEDVRSPLDKFCGLFGIIPASSVDINTGKLNVKIPLNAGLYNLSEPKLNDGTKLNGNCYFRLTRHVEDKSLPDVIWIVFMPFANVKNYLPYYHDKVVVCANEIDIERSDYDLITRKMKEFKAPKIMYSFIALDPRTNTFRNIRVRQYFAKVFRETMNELGLNPEGSICPDEMLGYVPLERLNSLIPAFSKKEESDIIDFLRIHPPVWLAKPNLSYRAFSKIYEAVCDKLKLPKIPSNISNNLEFQNQWTRAEIPLRIGYSTAGPADPTGDLKMVMTPGLHKILDYITSDSELQSYVQNIQYYDEHSHKLFNEFLFKDSRLAIISNYSRVYFSTRDSLILAPYRKHDPYVWEFFKSKK